MLNTSNLKKKVLVSEYVNSYIQTSIRNGKRKVKLEVYITENKH